MTVILCTLLQESLLVAIAVFPLYVHLYGIPCLKSIVSLIYVEHRESTVPASSASRLARTMRIAVSAFAFASLPTPFASINVRKLFNWRLPGNMG